MSRAIRSQWIGFVVGLLAALALAALLSSGSSTLAGPPGQGEPPPDEAALEPASPDVVSRNVPIQGRLTDAGGNPINATLDITFTLYDNDTGGTAMCSDSDLVTVTNGLFNAVLNGCSASDINGRDLYLGVRVESDPEMTPRQTIYPVPYAYTIVPGAHIGGDGAGDGNLHLHQADGAETIEFDANLGRLTLGGHGEDGDIYVYESTHVTRTFQVDGNTGDVKQYRSGDGLVKAGAMVTCGSAGSEVKYFFNNVTSNAITVVNGASAGRCTLDFNFDITDRYVVAMGMEDDTPRGVSCSRSGLPDDRLACFRWNGDTGAGVNGDIMVLIY